MDGTQMECAKELNLTKIPANVIDEPKILPKISFSCLISTIFKKEWALFPTALKLEVMIEKIGRIMKSFV